MEIGKIIGIVVISIIVATKESHSSSLSRASYGESCDKGLRCDSRASLQCGQESVCQCVKPDEMTYDKTKGKCVVLSGERCSYTAVEMLNDQTQEKRWTEKLDCVNFADCNSEGYCDCRSDYFEDTEGQCQPKRLHGQNCSRDAECRTDRHLICDNGMCSCNRTEAVYDPSYGQCVARAGSSCVKYERCVRNANCPRRQGYYSYNQGSLYDRCTCGSEYKQSKNGLCLAKYGMSCDFKSAPCSEEYVCINSKCTCHFPDHQQHRVINSGTPQCISYVRGPCSEKIDGNVLEFSCTENSECVIKNDVHQCACKKGYIESENRQCSIAHGEPCGDRSSESCDAIAKLICKNGFCSCPDFQEYDSELAKCRGLVGSKCLLNETYNFCVDGAKCHPYRDTDIGQGVCTCITPSIPDATRKCTSLVLIEEENTIDVVNGTVESMEEDVVVVEE